MAEKRITDEQLRDEIEQGLKPAQIAAKYGMSRVTVSDRVRKMNLTTTAVTTLAPVGTPESRTFVETQRDAISELLELLDGIKKLYAACAAWLQDPENPDKFDIGPRANEVMVTYWDADEDSEGKPKMVKRKAKLSVLLKRLEDDGILTLQGEQKIADPRTLILQTAQECRQIITQCKELALLMADARSMERLREALLTEIGKVSPDVAENIAQAVRRTIVLHAAAGGPGSPD